MFTQEDIKKLTKYQIEVFKDVFVTKDEFSEFREDIGDKFSTLQSSVDAIARTTSKIETELIVGNYRTKALEDWVDKAAPKIGVPFKH